MYETYIDTIKEKDPVNAELLELLLDEIQELEERIEFLEATNEKNKR